MQRDLSTYERSSPAVVAKAIHCMMFTISINVADTMFETWPSSLDLLNLGSESTLVTAVTVDGRNLGHTIGCE